MYSNLLKTFSTCHTLKKISICLNSSYANSIVRYMSFDLPSFWSGISMGPPDAILGISDAYKRDPDPNKINLGVGAYRDDHGKPYILPSVRMAEDMIHCEQLNHEYAPISGEAEFCQSTARLVFGDHPLVESGSVCTVQTLSGTGALRMGLEFITQFYPCNQEVYLPSPTWGNHIQLCNRLKMKHYNYRYYNPITHAFDLKGTLEDIGKAKPGSIILLHACAHNPTGVDPKPEEWKQLSDAVKKMKLLPFFDMAYQGFATGNIANDAYAPRLFASEGHHVLLAQSFAKNMGLYGERVGALHIVCESPETAEKVLSQMKILIRVAYSNPPLYGSRIVNTILNTPAIRCRWINDLKGMSDRIKLMRQKLLAELKNSGSTRDWQHIVDQIGMFCYTGLKPEQVIRLTKEFHIYLTKDGRISIAGISSKNVRYLAESIHKVTKPEKNPQEGLPLMPTDKKRIG